MGMDDQLLSSLAPQLDPPTADLPNAVNQKTYEQPLDSTTPAPSSRHRGADQTPSRRISTGRSLLEHRSPQIGVADIDLFRTFKAVGDIIAVSTACRLPAQSAKPNAGASSADPSLTLPQSMLRLNRRAAQQTPAVAANADFIFAMASLENRGRRRGVVLTVPEFVEKTVDGGPARHDITCISEILQAWLRFDEHDNDVQYAVGRM